MLATQLLIASALLGGHPQPLVVDFPAASTCPTCPTSMPVAAPLPCPAQAPTVCPVLTVPLPGIFCKTMDPCFVKRCQAEKYRTTGDMYPSCTLMPPACHGNYYFRPYNVSTIGKHQAIAQGWGEDPRMPYTTRLFDMLYAGHGLPSAYCPSGDCPHSSGTMPHSEHLSLPMPQPTTPDGTTPILHQSYEDPIQSGTRASDHFLPIR